MIPQKKGGRAGWPEPSKPSSMDHDVGGQTGVVPSNRVIPDWDPASLYNIMREL